MRGRSSKGLESVVRMGYHHSLMAVYKSCGGLLITARQRGDDLRVEVVLECGISARPKEANVPEVERGAENGAGGTSAEVERILFHGLIVRDPDASR